MPTIMWLLGLTALAVGLYCLVGTAATVFVGVVALLWRFIGMHCAVISAGILLTTRALIWAAPDLANGIYVLFVLVVLAKASSRPTRNKDNKLDNRR